MPVQLEDKIRGLEAQVKKLQSQKDRLLKELDAVEERFEGLDRLYRRYFPVILDVVSRDDSSFARACKDLGSAMRKNASPVKMAYIFDQMKNAMIKEDIGPVSLTPKKGILASLKKKPVQAILEDFRQSYHDLVNQLKSTLDKKYAKNLDSLMGRILHASDSAELNEIRESLFSLIFLYISETSQDREKVNRFIKDIVGKILEIETKLASSFDHAHSLASSNTGFESVLSSEMDGLRQSSDMAGSLDDLKVKITQGLASIENALKKKQKVDEAINRLAVKNRKSFKSGFARLKKELHDATRYTEALEKKLNQDQLTGAFNRRAYDKKIAEEMARFLRYGAVFSILLIDADEFKGINDRYGHAIGDRCLKEIIKRAHPLVRKNDMLARYGGEEFVVIMPQTDAQGGRLAAEKIRQTIEKIEFLYKNETVKVTVSIGVSCVQEGDRTHEQVFERADIAVYKAKENGRNQVMVQ